MTGRISEQLGMNGVAALIAIVSGIGCASATAPGPAPVRFPNGAISVEMQYLYLIGGKFVKVRASIPEEGWQRSRVPAFARELARRMAAGTGVSG